MPVQDARTPRAITVKLTETDEHRRRAHDNHGQTLERLAQRGGLGWRELLSVLTDKPWRHYDRLSTDEARDRCLAFECVELV